MRTSIVVWLALSACGRGATSLVPGPQDEVTAAPAGEDATPARACVPQEQLAGLWACDTIAAMEIVDLNVASWRSGEPAEISVTVRNDASLFLNYPGIRVESSLGPSAIEQRYGMWACGTEQMSLALPLTAAAGQRVTFTAVAIALDSQCPNAARRSIATTAP